MDCSRRDLNVHAKKRGRAPRNKVDSARNFRTNSLQEQSVLERTNGKRRCAAARRGGRRRTSRCRRRPIESNPGRSRRPKPFKRERRNANQETPRIVDEIDTSQRSETERKSKPRKKGLCQTFGDQGGVVIGADAEERESSKNATPKSREVRIEARTVQSSGSKSVKQRGTVRILTFDRILPSQRVILHNCYYVELNFRLFRRFPVRFTVRGCSDPNGF